MAFSVVPIGVNSAFTTKGFQTNYLVRKGNTLLLVDCGTTAPLGLLPLDLRLIDMATVYVSHLHLDHVGGLVQLGLNRYFAKLERPKVYLQSALLEDIWPRFLAGVMGRFVDQRGAAHTASSSTFFDFIPLDGTIDSSVKIGEVEIRLVEVQHVPGTPSHGIIVEDKVFITTDTIFLPDLLERMADRFALEAIFHDCSLLESQRQVHTTLTQLNSLPEDLKQLLLLTHYEDDVEDLPPTDLVFAEAGTRYEFS